MKAHWAPTKVTENEREFHKILENAKLADADYDVIE